MANGTIEQLNFEILLHDDKFNARIKADKEAARDLNMTLSQYLTAKKKEAAVIAQVDKVRREHTRTLNLENSAYVSQSKLLRDLTALAGTYFSVRGVQSFLKSLIDVTGQFEVQKMALTSMLQSSQVADRIFNEYRQLALNSPYTFQDFTKFGKQLTAFNIPAGNLVDTTKMLADVAAGLGVDMGRIILAYGQIKSAGVLKGTELRQLTEAGVPILDSLAKQIEETTGKTVKLAEVFQMISKKQIPFEMVEKAFRDMTSEGGKFYNMQEVLVETLQGKIGKLRDAWQQALYDMGSESTINKVLKGSVDLLTQMVLHLDDIAKAIIPVIAGFGAYGVALAALAIRQKALELANFISMLLKVATGSKAAASALVLMGNSAKMVAVSVGAFAALAVAIVEIVKVANRGRRAMDDFNKTLKDIHETSMENNSYEKEISDIKRLQKILNDSNGSYATRLGALEELRSIVPSYHAELTAEGVLIKNNKEALDDYIKSLERESKILGMKDELESLRKQKKEIEDDIKEISATLGASSNGGTVPPGYFVQGGQTPLSQALLPGDLDTKEKQLAVVDDRIKEIEGDIESLTKETFDAEKVVTTTLSTTVDTITSTKKKIAELRKKAAGSGLTDGDVKLLKSLTAELAEAEKEYELLTGNKYGEQSSKNDKERTKRISSIKAEIAVLEDYKKAYDRLEPIYGKETESIISGVFGSDIDYQATISKIETLIEELRGLGAAGSEAATAIETRLGMDAVSKMERAGKAMKKADDDLAKATQKISEYLGKDFSRQGEGVAETISKLLSDLVNKNLKVDLETDELIADLEKATKEHFIEANADLFAEIGASTDEQKALADAFWDEYKRRRIAEIKAQATQQKEANTADAQQILVSKARDIFNEQMEGFDLTDWSQKRVGEILKIRKALKELKVPESIQKLFEGKEEGLKQLSDDLFDIINKMLAGTVDPALWKSVVRGAHALAADFNSAAQALTNYAESTGNEKLTETVKVVAGIVQNLQAAEKGAEAWQGWWGAIIGGTLDIFTQVMNAIAESNREANDFADAIANIRLEAEKARVEGLFKGNIFGSAADLDRTNAKIVELRKNMAAMGAIYKGKIISRYTTSGREASAFRTKKKGYDEYTELYVLAERMQMDLYDKYGNLNAELLRHILSVYDTTLSDEEKQWLNEAASFSENFISIMNQVESEVSNIFGTIADDMADKVIDKWIEAGTAAIDYVDILDEVGRAYAKMLIKSAIFKNVLNDEEADKIVSQYMSGDTSGAMSAIADDMQKIAEMEPLFTSIMQTIDPYLNKDKAGDSLANGINKQLVEGNSSLIASYINAMRADLSAQRQDVSIMKGDVNAILTNTSYIPTLNDYMAKVAADAHDTAQSNRQILTELQSVITSSPGRRSIAVDVQ